MDEFRSQESGVRINWTPIKYFLFWLLASAPKDQHPGDYPLPISRAFIAMLLAEFIAVTLAS